MRWVQTARYLKGHTHGQFALHRLLSKLVDRVWCGLTVCATVWRLSNRFEFCCATVGCVAVWSVYWHICELLYHVTISSLIRLPCPNTLLLFNQSFVQILLFLFRYTVSSSVTKARIIAKQATVDMFSLWHLPRDWSLRKLTVSCTDTVSCCIARSEPDGTRWRTGGEVKGKDVNGVGSQ